MARSPETEEGAASPAAEPAAEPAPAGEPAAEPAPAAPDYSFVPDEFRTDDGVDGAAFSEHYQKLVENQRPEAPESYDYKLPEDFDAGVELPDGFKPTIDAEQNADLLNAFGETLKKHGASQDMATDLLGTLARYQAQGYAQAHQMVQEDYQKLGATDAAREQRMSNLQRQIESRLPEELAGAVMTMTTSAAGVRALEALLKPAGPTSGVPQPQPQAPADPLAARYPTTTNR